MRLGLSVPWAALQAGFLEPQSLPRTRTHSRDAKPPRVKTQSLARFTGKGCHLVANGQALHFGEETKLGKSQALENRCRPWGWGWEWGWSGRGGRLYLALLLKSTHRVPVGCGRDGTGLP